MGIEPDPAKPNQVVSDEEALAAIDRLESEDNPSIEPESIQKTPQPPSVPFQTPLQPTQLQTPSQVPENTFSATPVTTKEMIGNTEKPIISGPKKSSKLMIIVLIVLIVLVIGGTVAYLKFSHSM